MAANTVSSMLRTSIPRISAPSAAPAGITVRPPIVVRSGTVFRGEALMLGPQGGCIEHISGGQTFDTYGTFCGRFRKPPGGIDAEGSECSDDEEPRREEEWKLV